MDYKSMIGFGKKKTIKEQPKPKPKKNLIIEGIKKDLKEWNDTTFRNKPKRWSNSKGLTEFEQTGGKDFIKEVGNAQVHKKYTMKIEDATGNLEAAVKNYSDFLKQQGNKKEAQELRGKYSFVDKFTHWMKTKWVRILRNLI